MADAAADQVAALAMDDQASDAPRTGVRQVQGVLVGGGSGGAHLLGCDPCRRSMGRPQRRLRRPSARLPSSPRRQPRPRKRPQRPRGCVAAWTAEPQPVLLPPRMAGDMPLSRSDPRPVATSWRRPRSFSFAPSSAHPLCRRPSAARSRPRPRRPTPTTRWRRSTATR